MTKISTCAAGWLLAVSVLLVAHSAWAQSNPKFSWTTKLFLQEQRQTADSTAGQNAPERKLRADSRERLIASPVAIGGTTYISCFIYLNDPTDLSALRALGVRVEKSFRGLSFITADVPVDQLEALAEIDNVTSIKVSELAHPATDVAREKTNVNPLLTNSELAQQRGLNTTFDGNGVVLGVIDHGFDFGHIAFKNADGTSRIKRAYVYDGNTPRLYTEAEMNNPALAPTTDNIHKDHGAHVSAIAGGSSVIVEKIDNNHFNLSVTNSHDSATYGGMAPGADLYLAGVYDLNLSHMLTVMAMMAEYADSVGKPLVVNCSWAGLGGCCNGKSETADVIHAYFGDDNPNHIILFATANLAGYHDEHGGGKFVNKKNASRENPLRTIIRMSGYGGDYYPSGFMLDAWSDSILLGKLMVLDNDSGKIIWSKDIVPTNDWISMDTLQGYNPATEVWCQSFYYDDYESYSIYVYLAAGMVTDSAGAYSLAIEAYPQNGTADINMWTYGWAGLYFSNYLQHPGPNNPWQDGSDDNSISVEASIDDVITVGAYASRPAWYNYLGYRYNFGDKENDITWFSGYATAECSLTGTIAPWITTPGLVLISAGNHYHTAQVDDQSIYNVYWELVVNDSVNPYFATQGTSMAAPVASGVVALWLQAANQIGKSLTTSEVKDIMRQTAIHDYYTDKGPGASHFGYGKLDALAGIKLITGIRSVLELPYRVNNDSAIARYCDSTVNVVLLDHALYKDNGWNPLCLPFSLDSAELATSTLAGCKLMELDSTRFSLSDTTLTVTFVRTNHLEAGKPYIIKWDKAADIPQPYFAGVTISNRTPMTITSSDGNVTYLGSYKPDLLLANDSTVLLVGIKDSLFLNNNERILGTCISYFRLSSSATFPKRIVFNVDYNDTPTGLKSEDEEDARKIWHNGQLYIRRRGVLYDVTGRKISAK